MNTKKIVQIFAVLSLVTLFPTLVVAEEGVTDTEIHIGGFGPLSGPAKLWADTLYGVELCFNMVNKEGGIHGRKIVYHMVDDSYNPAKTKAGVKNLQETSGVFAWVGGVGTPTGMAVKDYLVSRNVPWVGPLSGAEVFSTPPVKNIFALYPHYSLSIKALLRYAVKDLGKKKIAIIYLSNPFGQYGLEHAKNNLKEFGMDLSAAVGVDVNETNLSPACLELRKAEPDAVLMWLDPFKSLRLLTLAKQMQLEPQWLAGNMFSDFPQLHQLSKGLIEGMITDNYAQFADKALIERTKKAFTEMGNKEAGFTTTFIVGFGFAEVLVEGLKRTGPDLTREKFIATLESLKHYKSWMDDVTFKPFDPNDPSCRYGNRQVYLQQCLAGGETKIISGWIQD